MAALIICATNPAAFRTQYSVDLSVVVPGPWEGSLNNAGESIKLRRPGDPEPDSFVPYYRVDRVAGLAAGSSTSYFVELFYC